MKENQPPSEHPFWRSLSIINGRSKNWPEQFGDRIPIRMTVTVRPDFAFILPPEKRGMILFAGEVYVATSNSHGAVCGVCACGNELGVKPDEFEVVEWYETEGES